MTDSKRLFDAVRAVKGSALTQADVDRINAALAPSARTGLRDAEPFYATIRKALFAGSISTAQFDGIQKKLAAMGEAGWPIAWAAYALATSYWETNKQMQPVREAYFLGEQAGERHRKTVRYYPWYGRGDVQLTWDYNYRWADKALGLDGQLIANPDLALDPAISARIMVEGMAEGAFTGKKLADYLPAAGSALIEQFTQARRIINGTDKAAEVAKVAATFQSALAAGGWA